MHLLRSIEINRTFSSCAATEPVRGRAELGLFPVNIEAK